MKSVRYRNTFLAGGILLLLVCLIVGLPSVHAAGPEYRAVSPRWTGNQQGDAGAVQQVLDQASAQGWQYVGSANEVLIFKK